MIIKISSLFLIFFLNSAFAAHNCSCVVFRLDDIQDSWISDIQQTVMGVFRSNHIPVTAGIIANYFGDDISMLSYILEGLADPLWDLEIAQHGFNHEDFTMLTYEEQLDLIQQSSTRLKALLSINSITSFLPPYNTFNNDTIDALKALNFTQMSSQLSYDSAPYPLLGNTLPENCI